MDTPHYQENESDRIESANPVFQPRIRPQEQVMSVKDWLITGLLLLIPIANIVLIIVWASSNTGNRNRRNWARASLILMAISIVLYLLILLCAFYLAMDSGVDLSDIEEYYY